MTGADRREPALVALLLLVAAIHGTRLGALTLRGEETRWAAVAAEMRLSGDWVVPRLQGVSFLDRPPLGSWLIAAATSVGGSTASVIRAPTMLACALTSLLVYLYARAFLSRFGAFAAAAAYVTMAHVLEIGRFAESEGVFTLLVSAALLLWHLAYARGWPPWLAWALGYGFAGLAGLTKGVQGPALFVAATWIFLAWRRDWRFAARIGHLSGLMLGAAPAVIWTMLLVARTDWRSSVEIWTGLVAMRTSDIDPAVLASHLLRLPAEVFAGMLPWSLALLALGDGRVRTAIFEGSAAPFLSVALATGFIPLWLISGARARYFMPLYPLAAVLVGAVWQRWIDDDRVRTERRAFALIVAIAAAAGSAGVIIARAIGDRSVSPLDQPPLIAIACLICAVILGAAAIGSPARLQGGAGFSTVVATASFMGVLYTGAVTNALARVQDDPSVGVARVAQAIPARTPLVSLDRVNHRFAYFYPGAIALRAWPAADDESTRDVEFFCADLWALRTRPLPFAWTPIDIVSMHRGRTCTPEEAVVVGRRLARIEKPSTLTAQQERALADLAAQACR